MRTDSISQASKKSRLTTNSKIIKTIINAASDKKAVEIVSLNLKNIPEAVADFFIICEASNTTQLKAICDNVEEKVWEYCKEKPFQYRGKQGEKWILVDFINVVFHCMTEEIRHFYNLEELWQDAAVTKHEIT